MNVNENFIIMSFQLYGSDKYCLLWKSEHSFCIYIHLKSLLNNNGLLFLSFFPTSLHYISSKQSNLNIMNSTGPRNMGYDVLLTSHISMVIVILSDALVAGTYVWLYWQMFTYIRFRHKQCTWDLSTFGGPVAKDWDLIPKLKSESIVSSPSPFKPSSSSSCQNQPNQSHTTITIKQYTPIINKVTHNHTFEKFLKIQCIEMMYKSK